MMIAIGGVTGGVLGALVLGCVSEMMSLPYPLGLVSLIAGGTGGAVLGAEFMRRNM